MSGKSTLIRAIGIAVYLAHIGMSVPALSMQVTLYDGIQSNIDVTDNIFEGESFYFTEVKRVKDTLEKISDGKKWLILMDELFKGTNVIDARTCSVAVIEGMCKVKRISCVLSSHLYEIVESLLNLYNIQFRYFEVILKDDKYTFTYQLKDGVCNDKIGYLILKHEGVVRLLEEL